MKSHKLAPIIFSIIAMLGLAWVVPANAQEIPFDEETITEAYIYLLGRALVIRQEQLDIGEQEMRYTSFKIVAQFELATFPRRPAFLFDIQILCAETNRAKRRLVPAGGRSDGVGVAYSVACRLSLT